MVVCVHLPRFALVIAAGGRRELHQSLLAGNPLAIAPEPNEPRRVGEVSGAAEAHGVRAGLALSEAFARCPSLKLLPADPLRVADAWEAVLRGLEGIGAMVEAPAPGLAFFQADGLLCMQGGRLQDVMQAASRACASTASTSVRIGAGQTRFYGLAAALSARARHKAVIVEGRRAARWIRRLPVELLRFEDRTAELVAPLSRLGISTLGELEALGRDQIADRFGAPGVLAHRLVCGEDHPLIPRAAPERFEETIDLEGADSGLVLDRALIVLVERLLARSERRGRTLRKVVLSARLVEGGTWRRHVVFREACADRRRLQLALHNPLSKLPAPAEALRLEVESFGPPQGEQQSLLDREAKARKLRLREGVRQARAAVGPHAAMKTVLIEVDSHVPERRVALAPFQE